MKPRVHMTWVGGAEGMGGESCRLRLANLDETLPGVAMFVRPCTLSSAVVSPVSSMCRGVRTSCFILVVLIGWSRESSSACETTDWLRLVPLTDGVVLTPRPLCVVLDGLLLVLGAADSAFSPLLDNSLFDPDLGVSDNIDVSRGGGLTGSYAGLSGSAVIGRGVEGVE